MLVKEVMTRRVVTVSPKDNFKKVLSTFLRHKISGAPVVNKNGKVVGIISEKDLLYSLFPTQEEFYKDLDYHFHHKNAELEARKVSKLIASKLMTKKIVSVDPDDHVLRACSLLLIHHIRRLPVINKGKLVGFVTTDDLYKNFLKSLI